MFDAVAGAVAPFVLPGSAGRSALTSLPWCTLGPLVVEPPRSTVGAWAPGVAAGAEPVAAGLAADGPAAAVQDGFVAVPDPAPCWAACTSVAWRAVVLVAGEDFAGAGVELP
ncbi:MAG TPA: hypothetical protein VE673_10855 [Pseudonocardiaceae bacterium]|nr:hypothetical protein [Pseudonocardiaceae bacterium]